MKSSVLGFVLAAVSSFLITSFDSENIFAQDPYFAPPVNYSAGLAPAGVCSGDFNLDGHPDLAVADWFNSSFGIFVNQGIGTFNSKVDYTAVGYPSFITSGHFDSDQYPDIAVSLDVKDSVGLYYNNGAGEFNVHALKGAADAPEGICTADFDGDGFEDIAVANYNSNSVFVYWNEGGGVFTERDAYFVPAGPLGIYAAHVVGNTHLDLIVACYLADSIAIMRYTTSRVFTNYTLYCPDPQNVIASDFNQDGILDIAAASSADGLYIWRNNGDNTFDPPSHYYEDLHARDMVCADFTGNGYNGMAILCGNSSGRGYVKTFDIWPNTFYYLGTDSVGHDPYDIATADFDGDGFPDVAVTNWNSFNMSVLINQNVSCCPYSPGDVNNNGTANGVDIVFAVSYLKGGPNHPPIDCYTVCPETSNPFYAAGDVNGNCAFNGIDITYFVRFLKLQVPNLLYCADCPPAG